MARFKQLWVDIYKRSIFIFIGNHKEFKAWIVDEFKDDPAYKGLIKYVDEIEKDDALASFWYNGQIGEGIIEIPKIPRTPKEIAYCAHECLHAVFHLLDFVGIEREKGTSGEAHTYLLEYFMKELLTLKDYNII